MQLVRVKKTCVEEDLKRMQEGRAEKRTEIEQNVRVEEARCEIYRKNLSEVKDSIMKLEKSEREIQSLMGEDESNSSRDHDMNGSK